MKEKKQKIEENLTPTAAHLPEHGPIDETGREILLQVKNVDITFGKGDTAVRAVKNASFDIYKGETFSLVGESGSGKTTVGRAVIRVKIHIALIYLVMKEHEHIEERNLVLVDTAYDMTILIFVRSIHAVDHGCRVIVYFRHLGELSRCQRL